MQGKAMTGFSEITGEFFVAAQLEAKDLEGAAKKGFRTIIINRPDGEGGDAQPGSVDMSKAAAASGLGVHYLPVRGFQITDEENVAAFANILKASKAPVLAYCKSGTRSAMLWAQAVVSEYGIEAVLAMTGKAGYDLEILRDELEDIVVASEAQKAA